MANLIVIGIAMAPVPWTTDEQKEWLTQQLPAYQKCSETGSFSKFWPVLYEGFNEKWPEKNVLWPTDTPTVLTDTQKGQLREAICKRQKVSTIRID